MPLVALVGLAIAQPAPGTLSLLSSSSSSSPPAASRASSVVNPELLALHGRRRYGLHLGLNGTLTFDFRLGQYFYGGLSTQLTGLGFVFDQNRNYVLSALAFGGVAFPLVDRSAMRLTVDVTPMASYFHSEPVNMLSVGLLAGLRFLHSSGFTIALKLPVVGYAGAPDAQRGGLLYYYIGAIPTVPILTVGYTF